MRRARGAGRRSEARGKDIRVTFFFPRVARGVVNVYPLNFTFHLSIKRALRRTRLSTAICRTFAHQPHLACTTGSHPNRLCHARAVKRRRLAATPAVLCSSSPSLWCQLVKSEWGDLGPPGKSSCTHPRGSPAKPLPSCGLFSPGYRHQWSRQLPCRGLRAVRQRPRRRTRPHEQQRLSRPLVPATRGLTTVRGPGSHVALPDKHGLRSRDRTKRLGRAVADLLRHVCGLQGSGRAIVRDPQR